MAGDFQGLVAPGGGPGPVDRATFCESEVDCCPVEYSFSPISYAVQPPFLADYAAGLPRTDVREYLGEAVVLCWYDHDGGPKVRDIVRIEAEGNRIAKIRYHFSARKCWAKSAAISACPGSPTASPDNSWTPGRNTCM